MALTLNNLSQKDYYIFNKLTYPIREFFRKKSLRNVLFALAKLNNVFFYAYLKPDFLDNISYYSKIFVKERQHFFRAMKKMRARISPPPSSLSRAKQNKDLTSYFATPTLSSNEKIIEKIEQLYENIFSLHLLRFRVKDYSIFEVCKQDFSDIQTITTQLLQRLGKSFSHPIPISTDHLLAHVHELESVYHRTLKILSPDPSIFLFFIQDLYTLSEIIENTSNQIWHSSR